MSQQKDPIKDPKIPPGTYRTSDTIITLYDVDTKNIMKAKSQTEVIGYVTFDDNREDNNRGPATDFVSKVYKNRFITWVGAVKDSDANNRDQVLIYDISSNSSMVERQPFVRCANTHQTALAIDELNYNHEEYTISFWVWNDKMKEGRGFMLDPRISVNN